MKPWDRTVELTELSDLARPVEIVAYIPAEWERLRDWTFIRAIRADGMSVLAFGPGCWGESGGLDR